MNSTRNRMGTAGRTVSLSRLLKPLGVAYRVQPVLAVTAGLLILLIVPTGILLAFDDRTLLGVNVWTKPLKFQLSIAVHLLTVAWLMTCLPDEKRHTGLVQLLCWVMVAASAFEVSYISFQAARGEASHFNLATPFTRLMYTLMGVGAVAMLIASAWIGALILRHGNLREPIAFAAGLGLVLGSLLGGITGAYMATQTGHWVGGPQTDAAGLPLFGWSRSGGDLRVAHFVGLHMTQALPLVSVLTMGWLGPSLRRLAVLSAALFGTVLTVHVFFQALAGQALVP